MAQDFIERPDEIYQFHPCHDPVGMNTYNLQYLTDVQQEELFNFKIQILRENHKYLKEHPEIKVLMRLMYDVILKNRPEKYIHEFLADFFEKNYDNIYNVLFKEDEESSESSVELPTVSSKGAVHEFPKLLTEATQSEVLDKMREMDKKTYVVPNFEHQTVTEHTPKTLPNIIYSSELLSLLSN